MNPPLAKDHAGMRANGVRYLTQAKGQGYTFMRREMAKHLETVAREYYAGNVVIIDEFLQLYCFGEEERKAAKARKEGA